MRGGRDIGDPCGHCPVRRPVGRLTVSRHQVAPAMVGTYSQSHIRDEVPHNHLESMVAEAVSSLPKLVESAEEKDPSAPRVVALRSVARTNDGSVPQLSGLALSEDPTCTVGPR